MILRRLLPLLICLLALPILGCSKGGGAGGFKAVLQNKGSDTMVNVAQAWAEEYKKAAPDVEIEVSGGGSGVGIAALGKGSIHMANSSRDLKAKEIEEILANTGKKPIQTIVGFDALAVFVHKDNPIDEISMEDLAQIYVEGGRITRWSELGIGMAENHDKIIRISRQSSSGTYEFLRSKVLKNKDFKLGSCDLNGSKEVVELVANTPGAIGYSGMGYGNKNVKMLKIREKKDGPAVAPSVKTAMDHTYPIARSLLICTLGEPEGEIKRYMDWILSDYGQAILKLSGYVPLRVIGAQQ